MSLVLTNIKQHPTQKPVQRLTRPGQVVLDPFCGDSDSTLAAARELERRFVGIEIGIAHCRTFPRSSGLIRPAA